ncbi:MAG: 50S ribosomal protein L9 [Chloroflexi bacterium]|nr:50S ribosomal protein L9 [Chloroflexota bacterium]MCI0815317.1 50S ribosomal protein L9 [Chloroflexota bacterium]MCI0819507.1 50S ribosomal protein L9 [Chloroflexota bacterium]
MKVVFLEEVEGTARTGDVKNVADGFARNYLLPRKLAAPATKHYIAIAEQKATKEAKREDRLDGEARDRLFPLIDGQEMTIEVLVGEQGKLFGSVTSRDIAERLQKDTGVELEHRQVHLNQPIREIGTHEVPVRLTRNVIANITVNVHPEGGMPEPEPEPEAAEETEAAAEDEATEATAEDETTETAADEPAATEASADDSPAEEAAPAPAEETATTETPDAPDEATEDEEKGAASREGS